MSRRNVRLLLPLASIALPLLYYLILPKIDPGWATATRGSGAHRGIPLLGWLTTFGPVALASIPGWRSPATSDRQPPLRLWPIAVLITFVAVPTGKYQAFAGVSVPLALLAVQGWRRIIEERRLAGRNPRVLRFLATAGVVVLVFGVAPATTWLLINKRLNARAVAELDRPDADALDYLARQPRGGVLTTPKVGIWAPALTDDSTYVGHFLWSPRWGQRKTYASRLFGYRGKLPLSQTEALALIENLRRVTCSSPARLERSCGRCSNRAVTAGTRSAARPSTRAADSRTRHSTPPNVPRRFVCSPKASVVRLPAWARW